MKIEVLYFDGCPHHRPAVERVRRALREEGLSAEVEEINVPDVASAQALGFLGSPTIRIDGRDIEPAARASVSFGLMCRTYMEGGVPAGVPPMELIRAALHEAAGPQQSASRCCESPSAAAISSESAAPQRQRLLLISAVTAAIAASLCCILPIVAAATGLGVIAAGAAFEKWRPYLLGVAGLLLAGGFLVVYRDRKTACAPGSVCATKPVRRWSLIALGLAAVLAVGLAAFPYYSGAVAKAVLGAPGSVHSAVPGRVVKAAFRIPDMDCPACAVSLSAALRKLPGVLDVNLNVDTHRAVVTYDPASQNVAVLERAISGAGFHPSPEPRS
jgi:copper chaperone CopZ